MIKFLKDIASSKTTISYSFEDRFAEYADRKIPLEIINKIVDMWVDEHGHKLIEQISPKEIASEVKKAVGNRVAKSLTNEEK